MMLQLKACFWAAACGVESAGRDRHSALAAVRLALAPDTRVRDQYLLKCALSPSVYPQVQFSFTLQRRSEL